MGKAVDMVDGVVRVMGFDVAHQVMLERFGVGEFLPGEGIVRIGKFAVGVFMLERAAHVFFGIVVFFGDLVKKVFEKFHVTPS